MKKQSVTNQGYEALSANLPESMGQHRMGLVHALTMHTIRHHKQLNSENAIHQPAERTYFDAQSTVKTQQPAVMSSETQAQVLELSNQRFADNQADIRLAVDIAYDGHPSVNLANENPLYDQKAA